MAVSLPAIGFCAVVEAQTAVPIGLSQSMPAAGQPVTVTVSQNLIGNGVVSVVGPGGISQQLTFDAQGEVAWTPARYGQYTLSYGSASQTVWVTAQPLTFSWWSADAHPANATVVMMTGANTPADYAYWQSRGVQAVNWIGAGSSYNYNTDPNFYLNTWSYAKASNGVALDELFITDTSADTRAVAQAFTSLPQKWGPQYKLTAYIAGVDSNSGYDVAGLLKSVPSAVYMLEDYWVNPNDYWGNYRAQASGWTLMRRAGLSQQGILAIAPGFTAFGNSGPQTPDQVRVEFATARLIAPEAQGIALFNVGNVANRQALDAATDQAITDYFLKPVVFLKTVVHQQSNQLVAWNIGNDDATGFTIDFLDASGTTLQTVNLASIRPNDQQTLSIPNAATTVRLANPAGSANLYPNRAYNIYGSDGHTRYTWTDRSNDGRWSTPGNWAPYGAPPGNIDSGNYAYFDGSVVTAGSVSAPAGVTGVLSLQFATAGWTITGSATAQSLFTYSVESSGAGTNTINVGYQTTSGVPANFGADAGNVLIMNGLVFGNGKLTKSWPGTLVLTHANTYSGDTEVYGGILQVANANALGINPALLIGNGASVRLSPALGRAVALNALSIDGSGRFDISDNGLIVRATAATGGSVLSQISDEIGTARNTSPTLWQGNGITSSAAASDVKQLTGLAVILNQKTDQNGNTVPIYTTFDNQPVDMNSILVKYTWNGDMNLDGVINFDDYFQINTGFLSNGTLRGYRWGDLNFDGKINFDDYYLINTAFLGQNRVQSGAPASSHALPEPGTACIALLAWGLLGARRIGYRRAKPNTPRYFDEQKHCTLSRQNELARVHLRPQSIP